MDDCRNIKDFTPISKLEKLEILKVRYTKISDISFLKKNKIIKKCYLNGCKNINKNDNIFYRENIYFDFDDS